MITAVEQVRPARVRVDVEIPDEEAGPLLARSTWVVGHHLARTGRQVSEDEIHALLRDVAVDGQAGPWVASALNDSELRIIGRPVVRWASLPRSGEPLRFSVFTWVLPSVEIGDLDGLAVRRREPVVSETEVAERMEQVLERLAQLIPVDRPAQYGDFVRVSFDRTINGVRLAGEDFEVELGGGLLVGGFEEQLEDARAGEMCTVTLVFPADYPTEELAGEIAALDVNVGVVLEAVLPSREDAACREGCESVDELRDRERARLVEEDRSRAEREFEDAIVDAIADRSVIDLPADLVSAVADLLRGEPEPPDDPDAEAVTQLRREAVIGTLMDAADPPSDAEVAEAGRYLREFADLTDEQVLTELDRLGRLRMTRDQLARRAAIDWLKGTL